MSKPINRSVIRYEGSQAERLALSPQSDEFKKIIEWVQPDGSTFEQRLDGSWTQTSFGGAVGVSVNGAITAVTGDVKTHVMNPSTTFTGTSAVENWTGTCKQFFIDLGDVEIGAESLIVAYSTTASDLATTQAACTAANTAHDTPDGSALANTFFITDFDKEKAVINWDGQTEIKSISLLLTGAAGAGFTPKLITVE